MRSRMPLVRHLALGLGFVVIASSCGEASRVDYAPAQTIAVNTVELDGRHGSGFRLEVRNLQLTQQRWAVSAAVTNRTTATWWVVRPHFPGQTKFGLFVSTQGSTGQLRSEFAAGRTTPSLLADRFSPSLPPRFAPGRRWSGVFSGRGQIPRKRWVRFAFGRFQTNGIPPPGLPDGLMAVTRQAIWVS